MNFNIDGSNVNITDSRIEKIEVAKSEARIILSSATFRVADDINVPTKVIRLDRPVLKIENFSTATYSIYEQETNSMRAQREFGVPIEFVSQFGLENGNCRIAGFAKGGTWVEYRFDHCRSVNLVRDDSTE